MAKIRTKLLQLQRTAPKVSRYGQLYANKSETQGYFKKVTMFTIYVSDERDLMLRPHVFESKKRRRNAQEWRAWFDEHLTKILHETILPGLSRHTDLSKQWSVLRFIGWRADAKSKSTNSALPKKRNKTRKQGRTNG